MSKISTYDVVPVPKLADKLIGTSVGGEIEDVTYNFTLQELLDLYIPLMPANNLQGILDFGNTATQDINLFGTITTTYIDVTDTASFLNTYFVGETHVQGGLFDSTESIGTAGQVLTSTGEFVEWVTLPPIFTPNLQQVLGIGNTSDIGIILDAGLEALNVNTDTATINTNITIDGTLIDSDASVGSANQVLSSTVTGVKWVSLPVYSATSPLFFDSATGVFSIQQAASYQAGYLSAADWTTFNGKQNAGNYITALTGEATASGPGAASVILTNSAVISKVLTGFNPTAGTINASDSILTAFGKAQSQINALVGGVQYKGTWNASTNVPALTSSVGVQGNYYIVSVAGNTNLNGITDWQVGDWAIFSETTWQKVDNTESVTSVNGFTGAVSLTTDNIPEGSVNQYFTQSRARGSLSFVSGSGAYNNLTGVITIPTNTNELTNGANFITLGSLSASSPLSYNNTTGAFTIQVATALQNGYLSATDWSAFNSKQNYLNGTGLVKSTAGTITYITDNSGNWNTAYDRSIVSAAVTGTTTKTLTLTEQDGNTIQASWTDLDTGLTSVGVSMPSAFSVANSPLTANGTIAITGAGTTLQYIDGTGALRTFPGLTGYVPYTGATQNVDLGTYGLLSDYLQLNISPSAVPTTVGTMSWNNSDGTMDIKLKGGNVTLQVGEENVTRVVNKSGIDLLEANYQVVRIRNQAEGGAQGQRLAVVLARANTKVNHTGILGIVTETINSNQEGFITNFGIVRDIDTTGDLQGETWLDGDALWLSETTAGALTNIEPTTHPLQIGYVTYAHANNGKIFVFLQEGIDELNELHDVSIVSAVNNQGLFYESATNLWKNKSISTVLGYTPANAATTLTINGTQYDLSANRTWSVGTVTSVAALTLGTTGTDLSSTVANGGTTPVITLNVPTASAANRGALSAADWATFNNKVTSVGASSPLASTGGATPIISIQVANGSQNGYLSSSDWTTFNNKQAAGNYITSLTGEATATGPGAASVTLVNASVTAKVLTGVNITGGTVLATDSILTAFGKLQNQINGLVGGSIYQGTWNASTNTPALVSGVGTKGYYYIVSVAGTTNLDGITDWFVGDWAIFDGTAWQKVDNTDAVVSVNGQTGAVSLTTDNIPQGTTNLYFTNAYARAALSFTAGSGAYNSTTGVITIPTNTNQLTNGASFITLASLSGTAPIQYNNTTGVISITQAGASSNGFLSSTDWNTFNNKQVAGNYVTTDTTQTITALKTFTAKVTINTGGTDDQLQLVGAAPSVRLTNAVTGATINGFIAMAGATNNYITGAVSGDMCIGNQNNGKILFGFGSGTATQKMSLDASGNVVFSGNITLSSSLSNGTFTYTLPGATGTLALTSQIPSVVGVYLPLAGGIMTGQIVLKEGTTSTDYSKGLRFPNDPYGGSGDTSGLRLYAETTTGAEAQVLELYVTNDVPGPSVDRINFAAPNNDLVTINGNKIWNAGNLPTPQSAITLTTTGTSGAATLVGATLNIPQYQSALTNPVTGTGTTNYLPKFTGASTIGNSAVTDDGTTVTLVSRALSGTSATFSGGVTSNATTSVSFYSGTYVSNSLGDGSFATYSGRIRENASYGLNIDLYDRTAATWRTPLSFNNTGGAATFSSSVTATGYSYFGGLRLNGADNSATIWKDSGDMGIYPQNGKLYLGGQGTANVMTVQSTGVGIGTTSPYSRLQVNGDIASINNTSNTSRYIFSMNSTPSTTYTWIQGDGRNTGYMAFYSNDTERMRITSGGVVYIANASGVLATAISNERLVINGGMSLANGDTIRFGSGTFIQGNASGPYVFYSGNTLIAQMQANGAFYSSALGTGTVYSNSGILTNTNPSDKRLKENIIPITYGLNEILQLNPVSFDWIKDNNKNKQFGFIAQEVQKIMPNAVIEGEYLGLEKDAIYTALINAIKELKQEIDILKN